jgi:hypothetical protein
MGSWRCKSGCRSAVVSSGRSLAGVVVASALLMGMALPLVGCGAKAGATETVVIDVPLASAAVTDVELVMGAGTLKVGSGATGLVSGTIRCNVEDWLPQIKRSDTRVLIQQKSRDAVSDAVSSTVNDWDLQLGKSPMRLSLVAGAYEGSFDLSGLTLQDLSIEDGAANTLIRFSSANPGQMERLRYKTGASTVSLLGLANANFKSMEFTGGAGTYSLDFSGQLRTKATARVVVGSGTVRIQVPVGTAAVVKVSGSQTAIDLQGEWVTKGTTHSSPAVEGAEDGKILTIELEMGTGTATLVLK